jgi:ubiquinone/menaquinone biosynthesis C-methylase UbiE
MLPADDHFIRIYKTRAAAYHALIAAEDANRNLLPALQDIAPLAGKRILDLGSGTGRIPILLRGLDCELVALDLHRAMLLQQASLQIQSPSNLQAALVQADLRAVPVRSASFDVAIAGWAIGHFTGWVADWKIEAKRAVAEMQRATKPGGSLIILETMGTGVEDPGPPNASLAAYYSWLEADLGFQRSIISTEYEFASVERAAELSGAFFGDEMAAKVRANDWHGIPEFTGIWHKENPSH